MRLNINLATKPYLDVRRVLLQWGGLVLLLALCTGGLLWTAVTNWRAGREMQGRMNRLNAEIAALNQQHDSELALLHLPQNKPVVTEAKFLNGLIARKSFSWTRVFMQLEEIMPPGLHVSSIVPELQPLTNTVEVHLDVAGSSRDAAVELVKRLEQSPSFRNARIEEEKALTEKDSTDTILFHLAAVYIPQAGKAAATEVAEAKVPETKGADGKAPEKKGANASSAGAKAAAKPAEANAAPSKTAGKTTTKQAAPAGKGPSPAAAAGATAQAKAATGKGGAQ